MIWLAKNVWPTVKLVVVAADAVAAADLDVTAAQTIADGSTAVINAIAIEIYS